MIHLGDITKIHGYEAPIVDVIVGGSPCQDLSVAGRREGLSGERSGLFMEQLRIVKEMRERDKQNGNTDVNIRPRYMLWENVPGAFSSNKGEDFRVALEETAKIADKNAHVPRSEKWATSGCIMGDGWSIAWRVLDAQFWGVPQRRRRIALVADFGGLSAPEILFVRKSLSRDLEESGCTWKASCTNAERSIGKPITMKVRGGNGKGGRGALLQEDLSATICVFQDQTFFVPCYSIENHPADSRVKLDESGKVQTLSCRMGTGGGNVPLCLSRSAFNAGTNAKFGWSIDEDRCSTLVAAGANAVFTGYTIRALTPLECERLQGYPDGWTDIGEYTDSNGKKKKTSDSSRYKALGNSIALPPWKWVLKRISAQYERDATLASLFDGIGGFPYLWEQINGKGSALWASEIEESPIAVTKLRIGE